MCCFLCSSTSCFKHCDSSVAAVKRKTTAKYKEACVLWTVKKKVSLSHTYFIHTSLQLPIPSTLAHITKQEGSILHRFLNTFLFRLEEEEQGRLAFLQLHSNGCTATTSSISTAYLLCMLNTWSTQDRKTSFPFKGLTLFRFL